MTGFTGRREDPRLLKGEGRYAADWNFPNQLYAAFLRSDRAHARIVTIDTKAAAAMPGVVRIFTGPDVAHFKTLSAHLKHPGRGGQPVKVPERPILARGRVRHVGEDIALVVATSAAAAQDAVERIEIDYEDLPVLMEGAAALAPGAPLLHDSVPGNLPIDYIYGDEAATADAIGRAHHVTRLTLESTRVIGNPMEPKSCVVSYEAATDTYDICAASVLIFFNTA